MCWRRLSAKQSRASAPPVAKMGPGSRPNLRKVDEPVDLAQQMVVGDMPLEAEAVNSAS